MKDEGVIWASQPQQKGIVNKYEYLIIPISILWTLILVFMGGFDNTANSDIMGLLFQIIFTIPLVVITLYLLVGRFFYKTYRDKNTYYAITNKRIIIIRKIFKITVKYKNMNEISIKDKKIRSDGLGRLAFEDVPILYDMYHNSGLDILLTFVLNYTNALIFDDINNIDEVCTIFKNVKSSK
jgi:uncharacterized pyridoxamine 5'-phosphate oxidase family protein